MWCNRTVVMAAAVVLLFTNYSNANECESMDIRNVVSDLERLANCTVIKGYLQIVLMERVTSPNEFLPYRFEKLKEITEFLLIYRVDHLISLSSLFPHLTVIRGQKLFKKYALIIFGVPHLEDIGLKSLISIQRGYVRIDQCPSLCTNMVDWALLTGSGPNFIEQNPKLSCKKMVCRGCEPKNCWSNFYCQKTDESTSIKRIPGGHIQCDNQCLGGCTNSTARDCVVCRNLFDHGTCVQKCSNNTFLNPDTFRCLTETECSKESRKIFNGQCLDKCPHGYTEEQSDTDYFNCIKCISECPKVCDAGEINSILDAERFYGCTVINGTLNIRINEDRLDILAELEKNVGDIEEIYGYLKIYRSYSITSLDFLKSLSVIRGQTELELNKYAIVIYENNNLQTLWNWDSRVEGLTIKNGGLYIHYNTKLCLSEISKLQKKTEYNQTVDFISANSNGYKHTCNIFTLKSNHKVLSYENVTVCWKEFKPTINQTLLGYLIYYIEAPQKDLTPYYGRDACSKFSWKSEFISVEDSRHERDFICSNITHLKQFTQYAFYVRTYITQDEIYDGKNGQSEIRYFQTFADMPSPPVLVTTMKKTSNSITLNWLINPNEKTLVAYLYVDIFILPDDLKYLSRRDYCEHPARATTSDVVDQQNAADKKSNCCCAEDDYEYDSGANSFCHDFLASCRMKSNATESIRTVRADKADIYNRMQIYQKLHAISTHANNEFVTRIRYLDDNHSHDHFSRNKRQDYKKSKNFLRSKRIDKNDSSAEILNLSPFTLYTFQFFACAANDKCSPYFMHSDRTVLSPSADDMIMPQENYAIDDEHRNQINVRFVPPAQPNGATVTYIIEYRYFENNIGNSKSTLTCINRVDIEQNDNRFELINMPYGFVGIRVQSASLAGVGRFTEWVFLRLVMPNEGSNSVKIVISIVIAVMILIALAGGYLWLRHKRNSSRSDVVALISNAEDPNIDEEFNIKIYTIDGN